MKRTAGNQHAMAGAFVFLLLGAFAVLSTLLVLLGARAYSGTLELAQRSADARVLVSYPLNRVRMGDGLDDVRVESAQGVDALVLSRTYDGELYETRIYCYDGYLRELFAYAQEDEEFFPEDGERIAEAAFFTPSLSGDLFSFSVGGVDKTVYQAHVRLRSGGAGEGGARDEA